MLLPIVRADDYASLWDNGALPRSVDDLMDELLGGALRNQLAIGVAPCFEVSETDDSVLIEAELPGMDEHDIELTMQDHVLTLKGEKKRAQQTERKNYYIEERTYGQFHRSLRLGPDVNPDQVEASFKRGVLTITVPKLESEKSKARTIDIKAA